MTIPYPSLECPEVAIERNHAPAQVAKSVPAVVPTPALLMRKCRGRLRLRKSAMNRSTDCNGVSRT